MVAAGALVAPSAWAQRAAAPAIVVNFTTSGVVTVTLNGSPVGTTSGAPTVIPGGYYSLVLNGPGDCINLPLFELSGPGVDIQDDMIGGEVDTHSLPTYFVPNSTYTWHIDRAQSIVYTFRTSTDVIGSATATGSSGAASGRAGRAHLRRRRRLGDRSLPRHAHRGRKRGGRARDRLQGQGSEDPKAGRYTITVVDKSSSSGFVVKGKRRAVTVTGMPFIGKHSVTLNLTAGRWSFGPSAAQSSYTVSVLGRRRGV